MTVTTLGREVSSHLLELRQVTVSLYASSAELVVLGDPAPTIGRLSSHEVLISRRDLDRTLVLHTRPVTGLVFPAESQVRLAVRAGGQEAESVTMVVDLSGAAGTDLMILEPMDSGRLRVSAVQQPAPLSELATRVRAMSTRALAEAGVTPVSRPLHLLCDHSHSMQLWWGAGAVLEVAEAWIGLAAAVTTAPVSLSLSSVPHHRIRGGELTDLTSRLAALVVGQQTVAGAAPIATEPDEAVIWLSDDSAVSAPEDLVGTVVLALGSVPVRPPADPPELLLSLPDPRQSTGPWVGERGARSLAAFAVDLATAVSIRMGAN